MSWSDAFVGALTGGASGAAAGPWGIAAGAGIGLLGGLLHKSPPGLPDDIRNAQMADMARLRAIASGQTETAADKLLRTQTARDVANQYALANTLRSRTPGAAARVASQGSLDATGRATEAAIALKAQEQQAAEQQLATMGNGLRQNDISAAKNVYAPSAATTNLYNGSLLAGASQGLNAWMQRRTALDPMANQGRTALDPMANQGTYNVSNPTQISGNTLVDQKTQQPLTYGTD